MQIAWLAEDDERVQRVLEERALSKRICSFEERCPFIGYLISHFRDRVRADPRRPSPPACAPLCV
jgi:hypothetical protein